MHRFPTPAPQEKNTSLHGEKETSCSLGNWISQQEQNIARRNWKKNGTAKVRGARALKKRFPGSRFTLFDGPFSPRKLRVKFLTAMFVGLDSVESWYDQSLIFDELFLFNVGELYW